MTRPERSLPALFRRTRAQRETALEQHYQQLLTAGHTFGDAQSKAESAAEQAALEAIGAVSSQGLLTPELVRPNMDIVAAAIRGLAKEARNTAAAKGHPYSDATVRLRALLCELIGTNEVGEQTGPVLLPRTAISPDTVHVWRQAINAVVPIAGEKTLRYQGKYLDVTAREYAGLRPGDNDTTLRGHQVRSLLANVSTDIIEIFPDNEFGVEIANELDNVDIELDQISAGEHTGSDSTQELPSNPEIQKTHSTPESEPSRLPPVDANPLMDPAHQAEIIPEVKAATEQVFGTASGNRFARRNAGIAARARTEILLGQLRLLEAYRHKLASGELRPSQAGYQRPLTDSVVEHITPAEILGLTAAQAARAAERLRALIAEHNERLTVAIARRRAIRHRITNPSEVEELYEAVQLAMAQTIAKLTLDDATGRKIFQGVELPTGSEVIVPAENKLSAADQAKIDFYKEQLAQGKDLRTAVGLYAGRAAFGGMNVAQMNDKLAQLTAEAERLIQPQPTPELEPDSKITLNMVLGFELRSELSRIDYARHMVTLPQQHQGNLAYYRRAIREGVPLAQAVQERAPRNTFDGLSDAEKEAKIQELTERAELILRLTDPMGITTLTADYYDSTPLHLPPDAQDARHSADVEALTVADTIPTVRGIVNRALEHIQPQDNAKTRAEKLRRMRVFALAIDPRTNIGQGVDNKTAEQMPSMAPGIARDIAEIVNAVPGAMEISETQVRQMRDRLDSRLRAIAKRLQDEGHLAKPAVDHISGTGLRAALEHAVSAAIQAQTAQRQPEQSQRPFQARNSELHLAIRSSGQTLAASASVEYGQRITSLVKELINNDPFNDVDNNRQPDITDLPKHHDNIRMLVEYAQGPIAKGLQAAIRSERQEDESLLATNPEVAQQARARSHTRLRLAGALQMLRTTSREFQAAMNESEKTTTELLAHTDEFRRHVQRENKLQKIDRDKDARYEAFSRGEKPEDVFISDADVLNTQRAEIARRWQTSTVPAGRRFVSALAEVTTIAQKMGIAPSTDLFSETTTKDPKNAAPEERQLLVQARGWLATYTNVDPRQRPATAREGIALMTQLASELSRADTVKKGHSGFVTREKVIGELLQALVSDVIPALPGQTGVQPQLLRKSKRFQDRINDFVIATRLLCDKHTGQSLRQRVRAAWDKPNAKNSTSEAGEGPREALSMHSEVKNIANALNTAITLAHNCRRLVKPGREQEIFSAPHMLNQSPNSSSPTMRR
ncbi:MAG: hypothetical protein HOQ05_06905, partial [Corynebacteriales bacterium]|nr:hypothetical protein [Mycobacteriales bacterium]